MKRFLIIVSFCLCWVISFGQFSTKSIYSTSLPSIGVYRAGVVYLSSTPENDTIYFSSEQPATLDQVSITFQTKTKQDTIWIDWGEDTPVWISGTTDQTKISDYSTGSATYNIKIYGDIDKITKFSVYEIYVTFGDMANNIGKMTGLTYLYLRNCSGVATCASADIPTDLTYWYWNNLPNLTATINSANIPTDLTTWHWNTLPKLTATVNSADIPTDLTYWYWNNLPNLTATINSANIPTDLTTWHWNTLPKLTATVNSADIPVDLTYWFWNKLPNLTATINSANIPTDLTTWSWNTLPKLTATVNSADIPVDLTYWSWNTLPKLTATVNSADIPVDLTYWSWNTLPKLTATVNSADIPVDLTYWYWNNLPNLTANGLSITALSKALTLITLTTMPLATARVDELLLSMDTFYAGANLMTDNATITLNGTGVGVPTGGESNTNIVSLISKATSQNKLWTFVINKTP